MRPVTAWYLFCPICGLTLWSELKNPKLEDWECRKCGWGSKDERRKYRVGSLFRFTSDN